jgi:hypothetical protein
MRGGMAIDFRRGKTAKKVLEIEWTYPVWKPEERSAPSNGGTSAAQVTRALPLDEAYRWITDGDRRPLLIMRECDRCKGTDHALLSRSMDNEQTVLLTYWFRCVKLPPNVLGTDHPFAKLFEAKKEGERIPHLFFADHDGGNKTELPGDQPQSVLWQTMFDYLDRCYEGSAKDSLKDLRKLLSQYDKLDAEEQLVKDRLDREIEKNGPDSAKARRFGKDLAELEKDRVELREQEKKLRELVQKQPAAEATPAGAAPAGATPAGATPSGGGAK